jgi:hypothetical protein
MLALNNHPIRSRACVVQVLRAIAGLPTLSSLNLSYTGEPLTASVRVGVAECVLNCWVSRGVGSSTCLTNRLLCVPPRPLTQALVWARLQESSPPRPAAA